MDLLSTVQKSGSRGGVNFTWDDVATSAHRENYLGHSLKAPVGRWAKGRDLNWYAKADPTAADSGETEEERQARERLEEIRTVKEAEEEAIARALGLPITPRNTSGANAIKVDGSKVPSREVASDPRELGAVPEDSTAKDSRRDRHRDSERPHRRRHRSRDGKRERERDRDRGRRDRGRSRSRSRERRRDTSADARQSHRRDRRRSRSPEHTIRRHEKRRDDDGGGRSQEQNKRGYERRSRSRSRDRDGRPRQQDRRRSVSRPRHQGRGPEK
ncbi:kinase phosphorylation protein-domain-containing protein [Bombardia bombarda]|uniref:Kinase phosphorylation protein-domain-containing protein n=1 Tax=Bombardia bombarda TaxID=252184 RepID=A0AA39XJN5_9PEZI|nr:kinase phosphorylation protein-domain-containing protein [Bombardia bombarda]